MTLDPELEIRLADYIKEFQAFADRSLARIAESFGVQCSRGQYDEVFLAAQKKREGVVEDERGRLAFRFHGTGCEIQASDLAVDFNAYPKIAGQSQVHFSPYPFARFLSCQGYDVDAAAVWPLLERALSTGLIERVDGRSSYYTIPWPDG